MFDVVAIGVLVSLSVFVVGLSLDMIMSGGAARSDDLALELNGYGQVNSNDIEARGKQPSTLSDVAMRELDEELEGLDVRKVDFDLTGMAEDSVRADEAVRH